MSRRHSPDIVNVDEGRNKEIQKIKTGRLTMKDFADDTELFEASCSKAALVLPDDVRNGKATIGKDDLKTLHHILCGESSKMYDSDDSLISEIDFMDAEQLAEGTAKIRENMEFVARIDSDTDLLKRMLKRSDNRKTANRKRKECEYVDVEVKAAGKKAKKNCQNIDKFLKKIVPIPTSVQNVKNYITRETLSAILEIFADIAEKNPEANLRKIDSDEIKKRMRMYGIDQKFYTDDLEMVEYVKNSIGKVLGNKNITRIFYGDEFGFDFALKDCFCALANYYGKPMPNMNDDGTSINPLSIDLNKLTKSAFLVKKQSNRTFAPCEKLRDIVLDPSI
ncbi:unnamed protein product [Caenorhabditis bovis]|uniref:Uncharacterized protein n=1 Tax=Caenorhabditis bovis TaxID=2654633 RepID=A0A8S1ES22_9PELO|nr:unnamed protein product [Caenorhabditis bovis]